jgi:rfaE bifunctional protein kinase chain/domain
VRRISPEAPVPILDFEKEKYILGGVGNVAHNLVNLGAEVKLATIIGNDSEGEIIQGLIKKLRMPLDYVYSSTNINTTKKTRFISKSTQLLRLDNDSIGFESSDDFYLQNKLDDMLSEIDCVIISDYDKGVCYELLIKNLIAKSNNKKIPIFIDPKGSEWIKYANSTCITPNKKEAEDELQIKLKNDLDYEKASKLIKEKYKLKSCLITRGSEGMTYSTNAEVVHQKVGKKEVFDVSGAGDLVIASMATSFCAGLTTKESLELSSNISSEVVKYVGTVPFSIEMLKYS